MIRRLIAWLFRRRAAAAERERLARIEAHQHAKLQTALQLAGDDARDALIGLYQLPAHHYPKPDLDTIRAASAAWNRERKR